MIWVQSVCKGYQQTTLGGKELILINLCLTSLANMGSPHITLCEEDPKNMTSSLTRRDEKESLPARPMPEPMPEAKNRKKERRNSKINETTYATCFCTFLDICRSSTKVGKTMYSPIKQYVDRFLGVLSLVGKQLDRLSSFLFPHIFPHFVVTFVVC